MLEAPLSRLSTPHGRALVHILAQGGGEAPQLSAAARHHSLSVLAASPTATQLLAHFFAYEVHAADCYLLYGSVGAGKSYFRCVAM